MTPQQVSCGAFPFLAVIKNKWDNRRTLIGAEEPMRQVVAVLICELWSTPSPCLASSNLGKHKPQQDQICQTYLANTSVSIGPFPVQQRNWTNCRNTHMPLPPSKSTVLKAYLNRSSYTKLFFASLCWSTPIRLWLVAFIINPSS